MNLISNQKKIRFYNNIYIYIYIIYTVFDTTYIYILHFSVFGLQTVLIKQSAVHIYIKLMFHIK